MPLLLFFIIHLYFLIPAVIEQIFSPTAKLVIPAERTTNESNPRIETEPVTVESKISKCLT